MRSLRPLSVLRAFLLVAGLLSAASSQDVLVAPVRWTENRDNPDTLPAVKQKPGIEFPEALRASPDFGYAVYHAVVSQKSRLVALTPHATLDAFVRASSLSGQSWEFAAARRSGKAVNAAVTFAVIFNPASAAAGGPEATPCLLDAGLVRLPWPKSVRKDTVIPDRVISVFVQIDETGRVTGAEGVPPEVAAPVKAALPQFRFAPARQAGRAVSARVALPLVLVTEHLIPGGKTTKLPQVVEQARPIYPFAMRLSGMRGEVVVDFIVDIEGRVRNPYVIRSLNPSFDEPAIDAVRKWRFEPGMAGDRPVPTHMQVPILFQMDMVGEGGSDGLKDLRRPDLSKLPEAFRYDTPPRIRGTVRPVYPYALLREGKEGHAVVSYVVGPKGQVVRVEVREATAPEFGQALAAAVEQFRYEPATKGGRPSLALLAFRQDFHRDEAHQLVSNLDLALLAREKKDPDSIVGLGDLDQPLVPLSRKPPHYPLIEDEFNGPAEAVVEVIVDDEGRVRLPRLVSATHPAFGEAALSGVANWRFEPPTRGGRSTQVRVRIPFSFAAAPAPAAK